MIDPWLLLAWLVIFALTGSRPVAGGRLISKSLLLSLLVEHLRLINHLGGGGGRLHVLHRLCCGLLDSCQLVGVRSGLLQDTHLHLWLHVLHLVLQVDLSLVLLRVELALQSGRRL